MGGLIAVGAYDGSEYRSTRKRLVLIEPQAAVFRRLQKDFGRRKTATLVNVACGARKGTSTLRIAEGHEYSSSLLIPAKHLELYPAATFDGRETVKIDTLDNVMKHHGLEGFTELVVDTQGFELEVFRGATKTLRDIERIKVEVNTEEMFKGCPMMWQLDEFLAPRFVRTETDLYGGCWGDACYDLAD